jgi:DivIVA domain-containing protein
MDVTPRELREIDFRTEWKGYHRDDVDDLLERAAATIEAQNERVRQLGERVEGLQAEEAPPTRETEEMLRRTLVLAQRTADEAVAEAQAEARRVTDEAETNARRITSEAEANARRVAEGERQRLEAEVLDLGARREALLADVEQLERFANDYRSRLRSAIERDLDTLAARPPVVDSPRPTLHEVDLPPSAAGGTTRLGPEPVPPRAAPGLAAQGPSSPGPSSLGPSRPGPSAPPSPPVAPVAPSPSRTAAPGPGAPPAAPGPPPAAGPPPSNAGPPAAPQPAAPPAASQAGPPPAPPDPDRTIELDQAPPRPPRLDEPLEAEVLDDDAFFASLREAVRDDTPLGPRPDDQDGMLDPADESGRFGNVFKRRR